MDGVKQLQKELACDADKLCDVRLFAGKNGLAKTTEGERELAFLPDEKCLLDTVQQLCDHMLRLSPEKTAQGFITLRGGHRMGLCGRVTQRDGQLVLQEIGSVCIRVAHEIKGCGEIVAAIFAKEPQGMLICGVPGSGKTTMLRDAVRMISDGGTSVGLCDERGEIAACVQGVAQLDVGRRTHVLDGCPKAEAMRWLLRGLCPQVLAMDELYGTKECRSVRDAAACGVPVLTTVHAGSPGELCRRDGIRKLIAENVFRQVIFVKDRRVERILSPGELLCCAR